MSQSRNPASSVFGLATILLVLMIASGGYAATIDASNVPASFKSDMTSLLQGLKISNKVSQDLLDRLMVELINLYVMLLDYHQNRPIKEGNNINKQVAIILEVVDEIKQAFMVSQNVVRGTKNVVLGDDNVVVGKGNAVSGDCNAVTGNKVLVAGSDNTAACNNSKICGDGNFVAGQNVNVQGKDSVIFSSNKNLKQCENQLVVDNYSVDIEGGSSTTAPTVKKIC